MRACVPSSAETGDDAERALAAPIVQASCETTGTRTQLALDPVTAAIRAQVRAAEDGAPQ